MRRRLMWDGVRWGGKLRGAIAGEATLVIAPHVLSIGDYPDDNAP